jgi:hypothetical protein
MKSKHLMMVGLAIFAFVFIANNAFAQDKTHEAAMSMLRAFFADPAARADYASKNPAALQAEQSLLAFPPNIQKRLEKVVLMIMQESIANAAKHVDAAKISGPEGAFNSFSPAVQKEIQEIAKEIERDPEFMKKTGSLR